MSTIGGTTAKGTKWAGKPSRYKSFGPGKFDTIITGHLTPEQIDAYQQLFRVEEISELLRVSHQKRRPILSLLPSGNTEENPNFKRDPSPPPKYDNYGNRTNTREYRTGLALEKERDYLVETAASNIKNYVPPSDYRKPTKTSEKIYIPIKDYPDINFVGLLLGPRGNTLRQLQEQSGARLAIRGKGSVKDGKSTAPSTEEEDSNSMTSFVNPALASNSDDLHVLISSDTQLKIAKAIKLTNEVIEKAISSPVGQNELKRGQLRELAVLNGTLRETKPYDPEAAQSRQRRGLDVASIVCKVCGNVGHFARDCKFRGQPGLVPNEGGLRRNFEDTYVPQSEPEVLPPWKKARTDAPLPPWQASGGTIPPRPPSISASNQDFGVPPLTSLFNFDTVKNYIIPKPQLCNKLISFKIDKFKVIGYPVNIENPNYSRNSFNFNFCFVFPYEFGDVTPYEMAIGRMGKIKLDKSNSFFKDANFMRSQSIPKSIVTKPMSEVFSIDPNFLNSGTYDNSPTTNRPFGAGESSLNTSVIDNTPGYSRTKKITLSSIDSLIQQIYQDLNNYSECCIPLDSANSVDIKLFPILPPPINIKAYQVPISSVKLTSLVDVNWDPTMLKILPYIDGINSIRKISELADANYLLVKQCIQHLMHYRCIEISDIFQFSNIYAPTNHIGDFLRSNGIMAEECQAYVITNSRPLDSALQTPNYATTPASSHAPNTATVSPAPSGRRYNPMNQFVSGGKSSVSPLTKAGYLSKSPKTPSSGVDDTAVAVPFKSTLFYLYRSLNQGQTVKEWYVQHRKLLENVDIRRFIHFGILRGIIYRVHSYPVLNSVVRAVENEDQNEYELIEEKIRGKRKGRRSSLKIVGEGNDGLLKTRVNERVLKTDRRKVSFGYAKETLETPEPSVRLDNSETSDSGGSSDDERWVNVPSRHGTATTFSSDPKQYVANEEAVSLQLDEESMDSDEQEAHQETIDLIKLLKGFQHYDSICTELRKSRKEVEALIDGLGSYSVVNG
ncbi:uncharacterized protein CANTADRAFT_5038 [Suhomyces tanzawaensis NRRL Y-17324]|uniref:Branchpoint-bridging protein n=1 Tax=Suhomyces tanzawaensis NRRL Y-17324 TaxID=984487 RepID=A0A1E4SNH6_9ASCO|nr:uncharacterized protein CANTADRAFT_5038 [Suhomyces tanzawaensis NRRL Y-17324]ODV81063.1 hypothetical protein CANTADRAFT_5038 [Suhomyces tanzawaensis NRRL Y-17324]